MNKMKYYSVLQVFFYKSINRIKKCTLVDYKIKADSQSVDYKREHCKICLMHVHSVELIYSHCIEIKS